MGTPLLIRSPNDWIYNFQLSSAYRSPWVYDPSFALSRDPDIWEVVRNDTNTLAAIQRSNQNIVRPWRVVANRYAEDEPSKIKARICQEGLGNISRFNAARRRLSEARFLGRTYAGILWERRTVSLAGTNPMEWYLPYKLKDIDRRRIHWVVDWDKARRKKIGVHLEIYDTDEQKWIPLPNDKRMSLIEYEYNQTEDRVGGGRGKLEAIYFTHFMKTVTFKKISQGIDRYANGILIGRLDSLRNASTGKTNEDLRKSMTSVLQNFRSEHVIVVQDGDDIEIKEPAGTGLKVAMEFLRYLDEAVERLCNGSIRPAGHSAGQTGARAAAKEEADTSEAFYQDDREDLDEVIDRDLLGSFLYYNEANFAALGLAEAKRPEFSSEQTKRQDALKSVTIMNAALGAGVDLLRSEYFERIQMTMPGPGDDVIAGQIPGLGGMDFGGPGGAGDKSPKAENGNNKDLERFQALLRAS